MTEIILDGDVFDVVDNQYNIRTTEGIYQLNVGSINVYEGALIEIDRNKYLRLHVGLNTQNTSEIISPTVESISFSSSAFEDEELPSTSSKPILKKAENHTETLLENPSAEWLDRPTKLLIQLYEQKKILVEKRKIKTLKKMWDVIRDELKKYNYFYTSKQCESKWRSLERAFKNKVDNNKKTGRGRITCPFERELSEILLKRNSIIPPITLDAASQQTSIQILENCNLDDINEEHDRDIEHVSTQPEAEAEPTQTPAQTPGNRYRRNNIRMEVQKLREALETRFQQREVREERNFQQRERLIQEIKKKNDLLKELITIQKDNNGYNLR